MAKRKIVPESHKAIDQWKYEIAAELGLPVGLNHPSFSNVEFAGELGEMPSGSGRSQEQYWGHLTSRDAGAVGGHITKRLIQQAEQFFIP